MGRLPIALDTATSLATLQPTGLNYNTATKQFTVSYNGLPGDLHASAATTVTDNRNPATASRRRRPARRSPSPIRSSGVDLHLQQQRQQPDHRRVRLHQPASSSTSINGVTYYVDRRPTTGEAISYLPETTQYAFVPADGNTYLIHYNDVSVVFPVISGAKVNAGVATVGSDIFTVHVDEVEPAGGGTGIPVNRNSFEINGNLYTITGTPPGPNYSCLLRWWATPCAAPMPFTSANTFQLTDPTITYTLHLDADNLPSAVLANFPVRPSRDLINVNDDVYIITYNTRQHRIAARPGPGSIAIANSGFTLTNPFDSHQGEIHFRRR